MAGFVIILAILSGLLAHIFSLSQKDDEQVQLITAESRLEEYLNREEYPANVAASIATVVRGNLSKGNFEELDEQLKEWEKEYRNTDDQSDETSEIIDGYRADIAYYKALRGTGQPLDTWYFKNADVLAATVAYEPVSVKYKAFINRDSALLPAARTDINLHESELSNQEKKKLLNRINNQRTDSAKFSRIEAYDMTIFNYSCRLFAVTDSASFLYQPYALIVLDETNFDVTAALADSIKENDDTADLDAIFAAPSRTDDKSIPNQ